MNRYPHASFPRLVSYVIAFVFASLAALAETSLKLPALFGNDMVLQRGQAVPVWGWAAPGEEVIATFAGQTQTTKADSKGKWRLKLDPLEASAEGRVLTVRTAAGKQSVNLSGVLVGDVWLCSGQSNMHFQMKSVENATTEIAAANHPSLRFFTVEHRFFQQASDEVAGVWAPMTPATAAQCSAVAYYFATTLQRKIGVPIGLLISSVGGTRIESWMRAETLAATGESKSLVKKWEGMPRSEFENIATIYRAYQHQRDRVHPQQIRDARAKGEPLPPAPKMPALRCHDCPSALHNGMIAPLHPFPIRGAIWYQGESNAGNPAAYEKLLPALVADWRQVWGGSLPFLFVQLAPHDSISPAFRETQSRIRNTTPHTAIAVTTDVGNAKNIHPIRKKPVGERLALAARAISYGEAVEFRGPHFDELKIEGKRALVGFTHTGGGLVAEGPVIKGFTMAGADGKFVPANAEIDGKTVVLTSDQVTQPMAVRYAWAKVPDANLFSREGLPAEPFRSDAGKPLLPRAAR